MSTVSLRNHFEAEVISKLRQAAKGRDEKPVIPGKFWLVVFTKHSEMAVGRVRTHKEFRYALTRAHAVEKVRNEYGNAITVNESVTASYNYEQAETIITGRTGSFASSLKPEDVCELRDDLMAYEAKRPKIEIPRPLHPTTLKIIGDIKSSGRAYPMVSTAPALTLGEVVARLQAAGFDIDETQLSQLLVRDLERLTLSPTPSIDGKRRYSESDLRLLMRHLRYVRPRWLAKPTEEKPAEETVDAVNVETAAN